MQRNVGTHLIALLALVIAAACGDDVKPDPVVMVSWPSAGTLFIEGTTQLQAQADGRDVTGEANWSSDAPSVATVSPSGVVRGLMAGEASIIADFQGVRGALKMRVFPNFGGSWRGNEILVSCAGSGAFEGICGEVELGERFRHESMFTQSGASVDAVIFTSPDTSAMMSGTIGIGGELQLPPAEDQPPEPPFTYTIRNWRSRADVPGRMTGRYDAAFAIDGFAGEFVITVDLENVTKSASTAVPGSTGGAFSTLRQRASQFVNAKR